MVAILMDSVAVADTVQAMARLFEGDRRTWWKCLNTSENSAEAAD